MVCPWPETHPVRKSTLMCPLWFLASWRMLPRTHTHTHRRPSVTQRVECRPAVLRGPCEPGGWSSSEERAGSQISFSLTCVFPWDPQPSQLSVQTHMLTCLSRTELLDLEKTFGIIWSVFILPLGICHLRREVRGSCLGSGGGDVANRLEQPILSPCPVLFPLGYSAVDV